MTIGASADRSDVDLGEVLSSSYRIVLHESIVTGGQTGEVVDARGARWMVRQGPGAPTMAKALVYLEALGTAAARVVRTVDGSPLATLGGQPLVVLQKVEGRTPAYDPAGLRQVGAAVGRIHALGDPRDHPAGADLPRAQMLPTVELNGVGLGKIRSATRLDREADAYRAAIEEQVERLTDDLADCPHVLLHGDAHPWNSIQTDDGTVVLIDWDSAGRGPAIVDLGFLLLSADLGPMDKPPIDSHPARTEAVVDGYAAHRVLTSRELERLADAVRFRALVFVAGLFADDITAGRAPRPNGWWARCLAADDIARRAKARFARAAKHPQR